MDQAELNELRTIRAEGLIELYRAEYHQEDEDLETTLIDILADMRHWASRCENVDWDRCNRIARGHFQEEEGKA